MNNKNKSLVRTINVPISLISRLRHDKGSIEMLACAIMIKRKYQNSTLFDTRITSIMKFFKVSHRKAEKLIRRFSESELFIYHADGHLFAKSFKSKEKVIYGKGRRKYVAFADYCRKMQVADDIKLRDVVRELRNTLFTCAVNSRERRGNLNIVRQDDIVEHPEYKRETLTHNVLGSIMGLSRSSAGRYVKRLFDDKRVSKTRIVAECVIGCLNETTERQWREQHPKGNFFVWHSIKDGGWSGWQHHGTIYRLCRRKDSDGFRHVIYNYHRKNSDLQHRNSAEIDGKW